MQTIPKKEKLEQLGKLLEQAEPLAKDLYSDAVHGQSSHLAAILGRVRGARESLEWHGKFLAALPEPETKSKASDAKAAAPAA